MPRRASLTQSALETGTFTLQVSKNKQFQIHEKLKGVIFFHYF